MNISHRLLLLLLISCFEAIGQSNTYFIEKLSKPEKHLPTVPPEQLFGTLKKDFLKLSVSGEVVDLGSRPVITGYLRAYQNHYPITISPEIAWLLICQGFSHHINSDPEKMRSMLVGFKDKKELKVTRIVEGTNIKSFPWESVFPEFVQQISAYTGKDITKTLDTDFSTSTAASRIAGQITVMESMKEFFNYKVIMVGCGIPEVTVEGSVDDWKKVLNGLEYLSRYDLSWWTSELKPVIQKIIDTKRGKVDRNFWMNMVKYHKTGLYGSYDGIDGWFLKFYPYHEDKNVKQVAASGADKPAVMQTNGVGLSLDGRLPGELNLLPKTDKVIGFRRSDFKEIKNINVLPKEMACVPFLFQVHSSREQILETYKMEFWAGFIGLKQDNASFNVKPEIGWAVNRLDKEL